MTDLISRMVKSILETEDIGKAVADYIRAAATQYEKPTSAPEWHEVWWEKSDVRGYPTPDGRDEITGVKTPYYQSRCYIVASYSKEQCVGKVEAYLGTPDDSAEFGVKHGRWWSGRFRNDQYVLFTEVFSAFDYTEVILKAQGELRTRALALFIERTMEVEAIEFVNTHSSDRKMAE